MQTFIKNDIEKERLDLVPASIIRVSLAIGPFIEGFWEIPTHGNVGAILSCLSAWSEGVTKDPDVPLTKLEITYVHVALLNAHALRKRPDCVQSSALIAMSRAFTYGAKKYAPNNWRLCTEPWRYVGAVLRHVLAWYEGEWSDSESGLCHLDHALASMAMLHGCFEHHVCQPPTAAASQFNLPFPS